MGISGNLCYAIQDMYSNNALRIKMKSGFTEPFSSSIDVRQGDTLSHDLFEVFINDLPEIFDSLCDDVVIVTYHLNCLLHTDDLILMCQWKGKQ